jgi:plastocyanin
MRNTSWVLALVGLLMSCSRSEEAPQVHRIDMTAMAYAPAELTVAPGSRVVWTNRDIVPHTATAAGRQFDSGSVTAGADWSLIVKDRGRLPYTCIFHPGMKATLVVQ